MNLLPRGPLCGPGATVRSRGHLMRSGGHCAVPGSTPLRCLAPCACVHKPESGFSLASCLRLVPGEAHCLAGSFPPPASVSQLPACSPCPFPSHVSKPWSASLPAVALKRPFGDLPSGLAQRPFVMPLSSRTLPRHPSRFLSCTWPFPCRNSCLFPRKALTRLCLSCSAGTRAVLPAPVLLLCLKSPSSGCPPTCPVSVSGSPST